jgi:hypothetical protein
MPSISKCTHYLGPNMPSNHLKKCSYKKLHVCHEVSYITVYKHNNQVPKYSDNASPKSARSS